MSIKIYFKEIIQKIKDYYNKIDSGIKEVVFIFIGWRIALFILAMAGIILLQWDPKIYYDASPYIKIWGYWDAAFYRDIARIGYEQSSLIRGFNWPVTTVFFPLYPLLTRITSVIFNNNYFLGSIIVSNLSIFFATIYLYKLVHLDFEKSIAVRTVLYLLIFPTSFFLISGYTESLFILTVIASFYYARKGKWLISSIFGFFSSMTRLIGVFLLFPIGYEYLKQKGFKIKNIKLNIISLGLIPMGLVSYMIYLYYKFRNPFLFLRGENVYWKREASLHSLYKIFDDAKSIIYSSPFLNEGVFYTILNLGSALFFIFLSILVLFKLRKSYFIFCVLSILLPLFSGSIVSMPRYVIVLFPCFIIMALWGRNIYIHRFITILSLLLLALFTIMFTHAMWVA